MSYKVIIPKQVAKSFRIIPQNDKRRIFSKLQLLEEDPYLIGSIKLKAHDNQYRIRVGDYRIRYLVNKEKSDLVILDIAHRKEAYKKK